MFEAALFRHDRIPGNALDRGLDRVRFEVSHAHGVFIDDGHLAVAEKEDVARVLQDRRNVGRDKKLAIAQTDDHRAVPA